jgi:hypothetical protein
LGAAVAAPARCFAAAACAAAWAAAGWAGAVVSALTPGVSPRADGVSLLPAFLACWVFGFEQAAAIMASAATTAMDRTTGRRVMLDPPKLGFAYVPRFGV